MPKTPDPKGVQVVFRVPHEVAEEMDRLAEISSRETHIPLGRNKWARMKVMEAMDNEKRKRKNE